MSEILLINYTYAGKKLPGGLHAHLCGTWNEGMYTLEERRIIVSGQSGIDSTSRSFAKRSTNELQEFHKFYEENLKLIYRYVYSKVGNREDAEDLTSQIFLKAVRGIDFTRDVHSAKKWLFQVARTTITDHWRTFYRGATSSLDELLEVGWEGTVEEESSLESSDPADRIQQILEALPERYREVLTCRFLLNLSIRETALRMSMTETNVKVIQFRALKRAAKLEHVVLLGRVRMNKERRFSFHQTISRGQALK